MGFAMQISTVLGVFVSIMIALPTAANSQTSPSGSVLQYNGTAGDLIVSRDGIVYFLSSGDSLFENDVLRTQTKNSTTISFNGCMFTLPEKQDVKLDDEFCALASAEEASMARLAGESEIGGPFESSQSPANAPLVVGGVVLSAGGIAAATGGDNGGSGSTASQAAGANNSSSGSPG